jgi:hypothetical protein
MLDDVLHPFIKVRPHSPDPLSPDVLKSYEAVYVPLGVTFQAVGQRAVPAAQAEEISYPPIERHCPPGAAISIRISPAQLLPPVVFVKTRLKSRVVRDPVASSVTVAL